MGINPSLFAVAQGHYFARQTNRFWPALSRSRLSEPVRRALGRDTLRPADDARLLDFGIGLTDAVKLPSASAATLRPGHFTSAVPDLVAKLTHFAPSVACFHGLTAYRPFARHGLGLPDRDLALGPQSARLGATRLYVVPNPSAANAHFRLADQIAWYDRLADYLTELSWEV